MSLIVQVKLKAEPGSEKSLIEYAFNGIDPEKVYTVLAIHERGEFVKLFQEETAETAWLPIEDFILVTKVLEAPKTPVDSSKPCCRLAENAHRITRVVLSCQRCGKWFVITPNELKRNRGKFCSRSCSDERGAEVVGQLRLTRTSALK